MLFDVAFINLRGTKWADILRHCFLVIGAGFPMFFQSHIRFVVTKRTVLIAKVFIHDEYFIWSLHLKEIQNFSNKKSGKLIWKLVWKFIWKLMNIDMKIDRILSKSYPFRCHKKDSTDHQSIHSWWVLNLKSKPERKCKISVLNHKIRQK